MRKGPKWSNEGVAALVVLLRARLEGVEAMGDARLDEECGKREALVHLVGASKAVKAEALREWHWTHVVNESIEVKNGPAVAKEKTRTNEVPAAVVEKAEQVCELLATNGFATDGGIKNMLFKSDEENLNIVLEYCFATGKIKRTKTSSGTEVITLA